MRFKVQSIADNLTKVFSSWPGVVAVSLGELSEEDILDPYFVLSFDVFHRGPLPLLEFRTRAFSEAGAFESSLVQVKDRFLIDGLPVRIDYKEIGDIESLFERGGSAGGVEPLHNVLLMTSGTYVFYRIEKGRVLSDPSGWLASISRRLGELPESLWNGLGDVFAAKMEHYLSDLGAAARMDDSFFYLESSAGFARQAVALLFTINRRFEPSHRSIEADLASLPLLPDDFFGRWETFLRSDIDMSREQKYEIACLMAKSILLARPVNAGFKPD